MTSQNKLTKEGLVKDLNQKLSPMHAAIVMKCTGITVSEITDLRKDLRNQKIDIQVIKNTLAVRAIENTQLSPLKDYFKGSTMLAFTEKEAVAMAKTLTEFAKKMDRRAEVL